jgi:hypothetical protein
VSERASRTWGSTEAERALELPCDRYVAEPDDVLHRAVSVAAPPATVFRWLCQLRVAPYSYDWIDNLGRRSPPELTPGLERLELGQPVMTIFDLVEFEPDRHITLLLRRARRVFGHCAVTYAVRPGDGRGCRIVVRLRWRYPGPAPFAAAARRLLPLGDMVMMRRQLLNLKALAERDAGSEMPLSRPAGGAAAS